MIPKIMKPVGWSNSFEWMGFKELAVVGCAGRTGPSGRRTGRNKEVAGLAHQLNEKARRSKPVEHNVLVLSALVSQWGHSNLRVSLFCWRRADAA